MQILGTATVHDHVRLGDVLDVEVGVHAKEERSFGAVADHVGRLGSDTKMGAGSDVVLQRQFDRKWVSRIAPKGVTQRDGGVLVGGCVIDNGQSLVPQKPMQRTAKGTRDVK